MTVSAGSVISSGSIQARYRATSWRATSPCVAAALRVGKTYALGVVLEQLPLNTRLPVLILDPNADFVRMGEVRRGINPEIAARLAAMDIRILHSGDAPGDRLVVRFIDLDIRSKAAVLRLDPLLDAEEYNVLLHLDEELSTSNKPASSRLCADPTTPGDTSNCCGWKTWVSWTGTSGHGVSVG
jgi:hypothetical protein